MHTRVHTHTQMLGIFYLEVVVCLKEIYKSIYNASFFFTRKVNLFLNLFSLMVDVNIPDIALEPDKAVQKVNPFLTGLNGPPMSEKITLCVSSVCLGEEMIIYVFLSLSVTERP